MISIPIFVFVILCIPVAIILLDIVLSIIDGIRFNRERKKYDEEKLKKSIQIMNDATDNPEYMPKEDNYNAK